MALRSAETVKRESAFSLRAGRES